MKKIVNEFKDFLLGSNAIGLATGVIIGGAVGSVVNSLVGDIFTPIIGALLGGSDFSSLSITIGEAQIKYGSFIQSIINFVIIMFCVFFIVKGANALAKKVKNEKSAVPTTDDYLKEIVGYLKDTKQ